MVNNRGTNMTYKATFIHQETGVYKTLHIREPKHLEHGVEFYADSELEAYQLALLYSREHGAEVGFCKETESWTVISYNEKAAELGFAGAH